MRFDKTENAAFPFIETLFDETIANTIYGNRLRQVCSAWLDQNAGQSAIDRLPLICCEACGGDANLASPASTAWQLLRLAAKMFDDVEDGEVGEESARMINLATGILFTAQLALHEFPRQSSISRERQLQIMSEFSRAGLRACTGQHEDLANQTNFVALTPDSWMKIARAKSGELFGWATWSGAMVAGAQEAIVSNIRNFGLHFGVLLQIADDFNDFWGRENPRDLRAGRITLPIRYMLFVSDEANRRLMIDLFERSVLGDQNAQEGLKRSSIELGAQKYLLAVAWIELQKARNALTLACPSGERTTKLTELLHKVFPALPAIDKIDYE